MKRWPGKYEARIWKLDLGHHWVPCVPKKAYMTFHREPMIEIAHGPWERFSLPQERIRGVNKVAREALAANLSAARFETEAEVGGNWDW